MLFVNLDFLQTKATMNRKSLILFCLQAMLMLCTAVNAAIIDSGRCGDNVNYTLSDDGTLEITGTGDMYNWSYWDINTPWYDQRESVVTVKIGDGVTSIGKSAFALCSELTSVIAPNSVTSIREKAFSWCINLTSIIIPNSVTSIGEDAFSACVGLTSITIPNTVTSIGRGAFLNCCSLSSITIPSSVTSIGDYVFSACTSLTSFNVDEDNPNYCAIDNILFNKNLTELVCCPRDRMVTYTIPNSVTSIGDYAFASCSGLTSITIPNSVTSIGSYAFYECSKLKEIHCQAITPPTVENNTFTGVNENDCNLYVTIGTKKDYTNVKVWKYFNIIEDGSTAITLSEISDKYGDVEFYTLNGVKVDIPNQTGIYIVKKNGETKMVVVKK